MAIDVETLTAPLSDTDGERAGPDLSYENRRTAIKAPFLLYSNGESVEERAWRESVSAIRDEITETRDVELAVLLTRGGANVGDLSVVQDGADLLAGLLEKMWADVHPAFDGEPDFIGRKSMCDSLTKIREFTAPLKRATVFEHRQGRVTGEDLERFASEGGSAEGYAQFRGAIETNDPERAAEIKAAFGEAIARLDAIRAAIKRTDVALVANAGDDTGTNFQPTYDVIDSLRSAVSPFAGVEEVPAASAANAAADHSVAQVSGESPAGPGLSGRVNTREDVIRAIDAVVEYYAAREPSSPVPVLMKRARHWVEMDFLDVLADLVPESVDGARRVLVSKIDAPAAAQGYSSY